MREPPVRLTRPRHPKRPADMHQTPPSNHRRKNQAIARGYTVGPFRIVECSVMPHGKFTGARTPQEPCKPHSAYVSAELRLVRAGVHGPPPFHERSRESVVAEDRGDDHADGIIDTGHERQDATEPRPSSPPLSCPTTKATTTTAAPTPAPTTANRLDRRTSTPRTYSPTPRAHAHRQLRPDRARASRLHPFDRAGNRRGPSRRQPSSSSPRPAPTPSTAQARDQSRAGPDPAERARA